MGYWQPPSRANAKSSDGGLQVRLMFVDGTPSRLETVLDAEWKMFHPFEVGYEFKYNAIDDQSINMKSWEIYSVQTAQGRVGWYTVKTVKGRRDSDIESLDLHHKDIPDSRSLPTESNHESDDSDVSDDSGSSE